MPAETPKVLAPSMYAIDVEPIPPQNRNNREVYLDYLKHLKESVGTLCEIDFNKRDKKIDTTPLNRKKRVTFVEPCETSANNSQTHVEQQKTEKTNECMIPSTGVKDSTAASGSKPRSNTKKDRTLPAKSGKKKVEDHPRNNKCSVKQKNRVDSSISYKHTVINSNSDSVCKTCNKCLMSFNHDKCVVKSLKFVKKPTVNKVWRVKRVKQVWQATGKLFTNVGFRWQPTGRKFTLGEQCPLTRSYRSSFGQLDSGMIILVLFWVMEITVISRVYYVEGLGHNLFSVRQFCNSDLEVAFRKHSCYVRDVNGVELLKGNRGTNLYTISVEDMMKSYPICLLSKASKNKSWLWHRRLNHLKFGTINDLARKDLARGLPRLKFKKDHLCSASQLGKSQKYSHKPKSENTNFEVLNTLHMDLCGPMRVQTINGKKYIL
ncbi:retrovirus-related pol polyprotein from transposon TNT 1-94 [Tanacetum coccineum]